MYTQTNIMDMDLCLIAYPGTHVHIHNLSSDLVFHSILRVFYLCYLQIRSCCKFFAFARPCFIDTTSHSLQICIMLILFYPNLGFRVCFSRFSCLFFLALLCLYFSTLTQVFVFVFQGFLICFFQPFYLNMLPLSLLWSQLLSFFSYAII